MFACAGGVCGSYGTLAGLGASPDGLGRARRPVRRYRHSGMMGIPPELEGRQPVNWNYNYLGKGCAPEVMPPEDELALLQARVVLMEDWQRELQTCSAAGGQGQGMCKGSVNEHYGPVADDLALQLQALCIAKASAPPPPDEGTEADVTGSGDNTMLYVVGGAAVVAMLAALYFVGRKG